MTLNCQNISLDWVWLYQVLDTSTGFRVLLKVHHVSRGHRRTSTNTEGDNLVKIYIIAVETHFFKKREVNKLVYVNKKPEVTVTESRELDSLVRDLSVSSGIFFFVHLPSLRNSALFFIWIHHLLLQETLPCSEAQWCQESLSWYC